MTSLADLIQAHLDHHPDVLRKDIAAAAGITPQSMSGLFGGRKMLAYPKDSTITGLANALGVHYAVVLSAIAEDLGHVLSRESLPGDVEVTLSAVRKLSPQQSRTLTRVIAGMVEDEQAGQIGMVGD